MKDIGPLSELEAREARKREREREIVRERGRGKEREIDERAHLVCMVRLVYGHVSEDTPWREGLDCEMRCRLPVCVCAYMYARVCVCM